MEGATQDMPISYSTPQERENPSAFSVPPQPPKEDKGPVPLSFPSILRNPGLAGRYAHLVEPTNFPSAHAQPKKALRRNDNEGKRWVRRRENARFADNPHIATPSRRDLEPSHASPHTTFPIPLPPYLPRSAPLPSTTTPPAPESRAKATSAGQFSLSLRGMRKTLRRSKGPRMQALVRAVEDELVRWLGGVEVVLNPDAVGAGTGAEAGQPGGFCFPGRAVAGLEDVREVERSPQRLVWWIENDVWVRYVVHCCARYHNIVSFSKDTPTHRLTHILRPNTTRPDPVTRAALATPPATDSDFYSHSSYESDVQSIDGSSDVLSESDFAAEPELGSPRGYHRNRVLRHHLPGGEEIAPLSDIASDVDADVEAGSVRRGGGQSDLDQAITALSLTSDDEMPRQHYRGTAGYHRTRASLWDPNQHARSGSSPSRSPARMTPRRASGRVAAKKVGYGNDGSRKESFYDFLFR
ncbi:hypothetical protein BC827DRAFT_1191424 [Russula dissimulans]|nr:hypothetical protein BC827DRAFT_1191424 [Russula dissimulans]